METRYVDGYKMNLERQARIGAYGLKYYSLGLKKSVEIKIDTKNLYFSKDFYSKNMDSVRSYKLPVSVQRAIIGYLNK